MAVYISTKISKGDDSISKNSFQRFVIKAGMVLGVAVTAASFFIIRYIRNDLNALEERVEDLEYDRLCEAYRQAGYEIDQL